MTRASRCRTSIPGVLIAVAGSALAVVPAEAQRFEVTPAIGYQVGGELICGPGTCYG